MLQMKVKASPQQKRTLQIPMQSLSSTVGHLVFSCSLQNITTKQHPQYLQPCRSQAALPVTDFQATYACSEGMCPCVLLHCERSSIHLAIVEIAM